MVRAQLLSELEEIITYKKNADQPDRQEMMRKTWVKRYVYRVWLEVQLGLICHQLARL